MVAHFRSLLAPTAIGLVLFSAVALVSGENANTDFVIAPSMFSPDRRYAVMVPVFHIVEGAGPEERENKLVEVGSGRVMAVIHAVPGYDRPINFHEVVPPRWSADGSVLLWKVAGKWNPDALVLLKTDHGREMWQIDLLKRAQHAILLRTRKAAPERYQLARKANAGSGSAFPDGFTVDVTTDGENDKTVALPLGVHADLTSDPKQINLPGNLESHLDAAVTKEGKFTVKRFQLSGRKQ